MGLITAVRRKWNAVFPRQTLQGRFVHNISWSLAGTVGAQVFSLLLAVTLGRMLGKEGYGELNIILGTVSLFGVFAGIGLGMTATKYIAEFRVTDPPRAGRIVGMSVLMVTFSSGVLALLLYGFAPLLAVKALNAPHLITELRISCLILFFATLSGAQSGVLSGLESFRTIAGITIVDSGIRLPLSLLGLHYDGLQGVVLGQTLASAIVWLVSFIVLRLELRRANIPIVYRGTGKEISIIYRFSLPLLLGSVVGGPVQWLASAMLVNQPNGYGEMGMFSACKRVDTILMFLPGIFMRVSMPMLSSFFGDVSAAGKASYGKLLQGYFSLTVAIIFPVGVGLMFCSDLIMKVFGREFSSAAMILVGVVLNDLIASVGAVGGTALQSQGRMWLGFWINLGYSSIYLLLIQFGAARFGANALAYGSAIAYLITSIWVYSILWSDLPDGAAKRIVYSLGLAAALAAVCAPLNSTMRLALALPVLLVTVYLVFFRIMAPEIRAILLSHIIKPAPDVPLAAETINAPGGGLEK